MDDEAMPPSHDQLVEILAKLEHEKWREWMGSIVNLGCIPMGMKQRWHESADQYQFLPESMKEEFRALARRNLAAYLTWQSDNQREFFGD